MSRALKCDRCGAYFDEYAITEDTSVILAGKKALNGRVRDLSYWGEDIFHLCDDCQKKLELFLSGTGDVIVIGTVRN